MSVRCLLATAALAAWCPAALAQQTTIETPHPVAGHSFHEQFGTQWGVRGNGWFFNFGGPANPQFGGFDPNAGARFGVGGPNGFFNFSASQGSNTFSGGQSAMVTMPNGGFGMINDQVIRPFVTGIIPVVGDGPAPISVLQERLMRLNSEEGRQAAAAGSDTPPGPSPAPAAGPSSAEQGAPSVAQIKAQRAAARSSRQLAAQDEVDVLLDKARGAQSAGKPTIARIFLQMAARQAKAGNLVEQQAEIDRLLERLSR